MGMRHVDGCTFTADIEDTNPSRVEPHPDRHDMAAAKREYALDAALLQKARDQGGRAIGRDFHHTTPVLLKFQCVKLMRATRRAAKPSRRQIHAKRESNPRSRRPRARRALRS